MNDNYFGIFLVLCTIGTLAGQAGLVNAAFVFILFGLIVLLIGVKNDED